MLINSIQNGVVWVTISSIIVWVLWTSRCRRAFQQIQWNVVEVSSQGDLGDLGAYTKRRI